MPDDIRPKAWPDIPECVRVDNWYRGERQKSKANPETKQVHWTDEERAQLMEYRRLGYTYEQIAEVMHRSRWSVYEQMKKAREG